MSPSPAPEGSAPAPRAAAFPFIFATVLLDILALGVIIPVLPRLIVELGEGGLAEGARITGIFGFAWALMQLLASPVLGALSDRFGRRPVILLSNLGLGVDYLLMAMAPSLAWLFVGRLVSGITAASVPTASAYIADVYPVEERAAKFGALGAAFGLGFVIGPAIGGVLGGIDLRLPFWFAGGLSLLNFVYGALILPESLPAARRLPLRWVSMVPLSGLRSGGLARVMGGLLVVVLLQALAHEVLPAVFVLYCGHRFAWGEQEVGMALGVVGVGSAVVAAGLAGPAVRRLGAHRTMLVGLMFGVVGLLGFGLAPTGMWFAAALVLDALWGLGGPALSSLLSARVGSERQGELQGFIASLRGLTGMVGPLLFTGVFSWMLEQEAAAGDVWWASSLPGAPFVLAAALLLAAWVVALLSETRGGVRVGG